MQMQSEEDKNKILGKLLAETLCPITLQDVLLVVPGDASVPKYPGAPLQIPTPCHESFQTPSVITL